MANLRANTLEGGSQGTTISTANSGGVSGDAYDLISIGSGNTFIYDDVNEAGALDAKFTSGGTTVGHIGWSGLGALAVDTWFRSHFAISATPTVGTWFDFLSFRVAAGTRCFNMKFPANSGLITFSDAADANIAALASVNGIVPGKVYRIEWRVLPSATVGTAQWWLYASPNAAISDYIETKSASTLALGAEISQLRIGNGATAANIAGLSAWYDNIAISTDGQIGPDDRVIAPDYINFPKRKLRR